MGVGDVAFDFFLKTSAFFLFRKVFLLADLINEICQQAGHFVGIHIYARTREHGNKSFNFYLRRLDEFMAEGRSGNTCEQAPDSHCSKQIKECRQFELFNHKKNARLDKKSFLNVDRARKSRQISLPARKMS